MLAGHLLGLLYALGLPAALEEVDRDLRDGFQAPPEETEKAISVMVRVPVFEVLVGGAPVEAGIGLLELPAEGSHLPGVILQPSIPPEAGTAIDLGGGTSFHVRAGTDLATTFGIVSAPVRSASGTRSSPAPSCPPPGSASRSCSSTTRQAPARRASGPRLEVSGATTALDLDADGEGLELRASLVPEGLALVVAGSDQDGFLARLLGGDRAVPLPLAIQWSSRTGVTSRAAPPSP